MELILGGSYQGKLEYVLNYTGFGADQVADGGIAPFDEILKKPVLNHFHEWVLRLFEEGQDVSEQVEQLLFKQPHIIIITNELGYGVVPMDAASRAYRELTGRLCCGLAKRAQRVQRVVCGLGMVLKENS